MTPAVHSVSAHLRWDFNARAVCREGCRLGGSYQDRRWRFEPALSILACRRSLPICVLPFVHFPRLNHSPCLFQRCLCPPLHSTSCDGLNIQLRISCEGAKVGEGLRVIAIYQQYSNNTRISIFRQCAGDFKCDQAAQRPACLACQCDNWPALNTSLTSQKDSASSNSRLYQMTIAACHLRYAILPRRPRLEARVRNPIYPSAQRPEKKIIENCAATVMDQKQRRSFGTLWAIGDLNG